MAVQLFNIILVIFKANCTWLKLGGHAMIDIMNDGSAIMSEITHECNIIRITEFPPPFVPQTLRQQALNKYKLKSLNLFKLKILKYGEW